MTRRLILLLAWVLTFAVLPYLWGRTLVFALMTGRPEPRSSGLAAGVVALLIALTWNRRPPARGVGVFVGWLVANGILFRWFGAPVMPLWQLLAGKPLPDGRLPHPLTRDYMYGGSA